MKCGLALRTDHVGCGSFFKIPFADEGEFLTGQWDIEANVGDELALFQRYGNAKHSFAAGEILYVIKSGCTAGDHPKQRYTYLVEFDRKRFVSSDVLIGADGKPVRIGRHYENDGNQYCKQIGLET